MLFMAAHLRRTGSIVLILLGVGLMSSTSSGRTLLAKPGHVSKCSGKQISPVNDLAAIAERRRANSTLCLQSGVYRLSRPIRPQKGQRFVANGRVVLDGNDRVRNAFVGTNDDVLIRGLVIRNFAPPNREGVVHFVETKGWRIVDSKIGNNSGIGIFAGSHATLLRNVVHHQGQLGIAGGGKGTLVQGNEIAFNNTGGNNWYWESGGTKFVRTTNLTVRGNFVHHNIGPGLWTDIDNVGTVYEKNRVVDNVGPGIFHEISDEATIRANVVRRNANGLGLWFGGAGILVSASRDVMVRSNTLSGNGGGIGLMQADRGASERFEYEHLLMNVRVVDNVIRMMEGTTGAVSNVDDRTFTRRNNRFFGNDYTLGGGGQVFEWQGELLRKNGWRDFGHDKKGTFSRAGKGTTG